MTESWLYFYTYEAGLYVDIDCKDQGELIKYLESYIASLEEKGFYPVYEGEDTPAYYKSPNEIMNFRYQDLLILIIFLFLIKIIKIQRALFT